MSKGGVSLRHSGRPRTARVRPRGSLGRLSKGQQTHILGAVFDEKRPHREDQCQQQQTEKQIGFPPIEQDAAAWARRIESETGSKAVALAVGETLVLS